jgi:hypothetical protein
MEVVMKGKAVSKPTGLRAKKWREASQMRGFANLLPQPHAAKAKNLWKKPESQATPESAELISRRYK